MRRYLRLVVLCLCTCVAIPAMGSEWPYYGGDPGSSKYSPLDQIHEGNVADLEVAWTWAAPDSELVKADGKLAFFGFKSSPIMIDDTLYISTPLGFVVALEAATGTEVWRFDTESRKAGRPTNLGFNHRGVAYWSNGRAARIFMPTNDARLWALDAKTGLPDPSFGDGGAVDLSKGLGREIDKKHYSVISAPMVVGDVVIVGSSIMDGPRYKEMPPGHVRGFDVRTGEQRWIFHTIPQGRELGADTWEDGAWRYSGNTNVWTVMSADLDLGYVYLPVGTPTNDWYGGHRLGDNLFAESLVCVDAQTGERVWHFQTVHHGLWDYDLPAAPTLVDIEVDGKKIKAVAQVSKQAFLYVLDRVTGEPVWPIEEKPVPPSNVPGERAAATQPFPSWPKAFDLQGISDATLIDFSPELRAEALEILQDYDHGPIFTPPSLRGTVQLPGWGGGGNWMGAAVDPETSMMYIPSTTGPMTVKLVEGDPLETNFKYRRTRSGRLAGPQGLPLTKPPYGRITAIELNTGEHIWMVPNGDGIRQKIIDMGIDDPGPVGQRGSTGPVLTKSLLFFAQREQTRSVLRAYDKRTGRLVHEMDLPGRPSGTPVTFESGGRQFISLTISAGRDAQLIALALPENG